LVIAEPSELPETSEEVPLLVAPTSSVPPVKVPKDTVLCNCYLFVKEQYPALPSTSEMHKKISSSGAVAIFYYPSQGLYHYALVREEREDSFLIEETNYKKCSYSTRVIPKNDPKLIGFYQP